MRLNTPACNAGIGWPGHGCRGVLGARQADGVVMFVLMVPGEYGLRYVSIPT